MSGVYIKGMEMPKTGLYLVSVDNTDGRDKTVVTVMKANDKKGMDIIGSYELVSPLEIDEHPQTNADRIRAMSDEELADELTCMSAYPEEVGVMMGKGAFERTYDAMLWWLKQEATDEKS